MRSFTTSRSSGPGAARARLCASRRCAPTGWHLSQKVQPIALSRRSSSVASTSCSPSRPLASPEPVWQPAINYIDSKFEDYLNAESRVNRCQMPGNRVQCCLYFIAPSGHGWQTRNMDYCVEFH
nr:uncharacterized protein LOC112204557 isoform X2 [Pan troglodytes]